MRHSTCFYAALRLQRIALVMLCVLSVIGCASSTSKRLKLPALQAAAQVDLERYYGKWFVIANIPYSAERNKLASYVEYLPREDGRIDDFYYFKKRSFDAKTQRWEGIAWVIDKTSNAVWKAQFIWPFAFDYLILETAPDYSWALVGHPSRDLAWIFSRTADVDTALYQSLVAKLAERGYDPQRLQRVPQRAEQMGQPGFQ
jgi:apolipoprotein D and lipocalin family protein